MNSTGLGQAAEVAVADFMMAKGYEILARNWRRRTCEIDIVATKNKIIYFVEVKYRTKDNQGSGLEYITARKLDQMIFAARIWAAENDWEGDYRLMAAEVKADQLQPVVEKLIEVET